VDQPDRSAWLEALAARVDDGEAIDWPAEEARAGPESRDLVQALRIVAEIADHARRPTETVQSGAMTEQATRPATEPVLRVPEAPAEDAPVSDRYRSFTPSEPAEIRRKLLFGVALILALASVYAGLLGWGRVLQYGLSALAVATVLIALISGATGPPRPPSPGPGA
jgi:hypothetical protein